MAYPVFIQRVLNVFQFDHCEDLWWRTDDGVTRFYILCNDTFYYATADLEEITPDNIELLEQTFADCRAIGNHAVCYASTLFVARVRKMKPLPEVMAFKDIQHLVPLFNAAAKAEGK